MHELLPATLDSVAAARLAVRRFSAGLDVDVDDIVLAVSEAVANVVTHAYVDGAHGTVELTGAASPSEVTFVVADHGQGIEAAAAGAGGAGYGLPIIRRVAERVELRDTADGVALLMAFRRSAGWSAG